MGLKGIVHFSLRYTIHLPFRGPFLFFFFILLGDWFSVILLYLCKTAVYPTNSSAWFLFFGLHAPLTCVSLYKWWCVQVARVSWKPITATSQTFSFVWMSLFGLFVYLCSISFISCRIKWEGKRLKINTLRPSLKEGHVNVRHQNVPLLIVTFFFIPLQFHFCFEDG